MPWEVPITVGDQTYPVQFNTESEPTQADIDEAVAQILQGSSASPVAEDVEDTGQGRLTSGLSNVGRGALSIIPGAVGGLGYLAEPLIGPGLKKAGAGIEKDIETLLPVNPAYEGEFSQKAAGAIGQAGGMLFTGGVAGALGKGAAAARGLGAAEAAAAGTQLAGRTLLGSGFLSGSREGGQAAERYGMEGVSAYTRALLGGAIEGATEKYLFGLGSEVAPIGRVLGLGGEARGLGSFLTRAVGTEAGEEAVAQVGGNIATKILAPEGVETPGIGSGVGEAAALGGIAGLTFGAATGLLPSGKTSETGTPEADQTVTVESGEMPIPTVLQNMENAVNAAVRENADVLPITAAEVNEKPLQTAVEEAPVPSAPVPQQVEADFFTTPGKFYRVIVGDEAFQDIVDTGEVRTNAGSKVAEGATLAQKLAARPTAFPSFSKDSAAMSYAGENPNHYIVVSESPSIKPSTSGRHSPGKTFFPTDEQGNHLKSLPASEAVVYKHVGNGKYERVFLGKNVAPETAAPAASVVEEAVVTETPAQEESPAAPPAEPTDATEGQTPTPGGVGAPPVVTNEPQTPSPAEQPVSAAQTPVATEPEAPLQKVQLSEPREELTVVPPSAEIEQPSVIRPVLKRALIDRKEIARMRDSELAKRLSGLRLFMQGKLESGAPITEAAMENTARLYSEARKRGLMEPEPTIDAYIEEQAKVKKSASPKKETGVTEPEAPLPETEKVVAPKAEPEQGAGMTQRDTSKPEQMTPEEYGKKPPVAPAGAIASFKTKKEAVQELSDRIAKLKAAPSSSFKDLVKNYGLDLENLYEVVKSKYPSGGHVWVISATHQNQLAAALQRKMAASAAAVDAYGITLPEGYVRQGDLYVFAPEAPPTQTETQPKPEDASKNQVEETGGTPPVESQPPQTRPEGEAQEGASQRSREGEEVRAETAAPGAEPGAAVLDAEYLEALQGDNGNDSLVDQLRKSPLPSDTPAARETLAKAVSDVWAMNNPKSAAKLRAMIDARSVVAGVYSEDGRQPMLFYRGGTEAGKMSYPGTSFWTPVKAVAEDYAKDAGDFLGMDIGRENAAARNTQVIDALLKDGVPDDLVRAVGYTAIEKLVGAPVGAADGWFEAYLDSARGAAQNQTAIRQRLIAALDAFLKSDTADRARDLLRLTKEAAPAMSLQDDSTTPRAYRTLHNLLTGVPEAASAELAALKRAYVDDLEKMGAGEVVSLTRSATDPGAYFAPFRSVRRVGLILGDKIKRTSETGVITRDSVEQAQKEGFTAWWNDKAVGGATLGRDNRAAEVVPLGAVKGSVKSLELVTLDNSGNVIPLSQRFNPETADIRGGGVTKPQEAAPGVEPGAAAEGKYSIYPYGDRWAVQEGETRQKFGDYLFPTKEEAEAYVAQSRKIDEANEQSRKRQEQAAIEEAKKKQALAEDEKPITDWLADEKPMLRARKESALKKLVNAKEGIMPIWKLIQGRIGRGYTIVSAKVPDESGRRKLQEEVERLRKTAPTGNENHPQTIRLRKAQAELSSGGPFVIERRFQNPEGAFLDEKKLTKTGMDFAQHLLALKQEQKEAVSEEGISAEEEAALFGKPQPSAEFGSTNTIFTKEKAEEASKIIKRKLGQTNVPAFDPELFAAATNYAGFLIEGGVRKFGDFSAEMVSRFGDSIRPFIKSVYSGIRELDIIEGMDDAATVSKALSGETPAAAPAPAPAPAPTKAQPKASTEPAETPEQVGIANAAVDVAREAIGLPPIERPVQEVYGDDQVWADAEAAMASEPDRARYLVKSLIESPRQASTLETAILLRETVARTARLQQASIELVNAAPENKESARQKYDDAVMALTEVQEASALAGAEQGRAFRARRFLADLNYNLAAMTTTLQGAHQRKLTDAEVAEVMAQSEKINKALKEVNDLKDSAGAVAEEESIFAEVVKEAKAEARLNAKEAISTAKSEIKSGKSVMEVINEKRDAARARLRKRGGSLNVGLNPADLVDYAIIAASYIAEGAVTLKDVTVKMVKEFGAAIEQHMPKIFSEAQVLKSELDNVAVEEPSEAAEKPKGKKPAIEQLREDGEISGRLVYEMVKEKVKSGLTTLDEVFKAVTADVQTVVPKVTERELRDLFSGYGKVKFPSQEELPKKVRELRRLAQLASAIEDAQNKIAPLRSGPQRDVASRVVREAQKELHRIMKEQGIQRAPGPRALKSALDAAKTRLRNQIEELEKQVKDRKRVPADKRDIIYDQETKDLIAKRDELQATLEEIDPPQPPTAQELIKKALKELDKTIAELEKKVKERDISKPATTETPITEQIQVKRDQRDALRRQLKDIRIEIEGEPYLTQEQVNERAERNLTRQIDELQRQIDEKDFEQSQAQKPENTAAIIRLKARRDTLREQRDILKEQTLGKKVKSEAERIDIAVKALEKSIDNLNERIRKGEVMPKTREDKTPQVAKVRNLRAERDSLRSVLTQMRKAQEEAAKDPEAEQLRRDRQYLESQIKNYQKKLASGDFRPQPKKAKEYSNKLAAKTLELQKLKEEWAEKVFIAQLNSRGKAAKAYDFVKQVLHTSRSVLTSFDVSAVFRQGGFIALGNPIRAFRNLKPMFESLASERAAQRTKDELESRPNFKLYQQSKLYLADFNQLAMNQQEEAFMSRWLNKIPKALGGGIIRGSQRAYVTFLNRLRADTFDAMLGSLQKGPEPTTEEIKAIADYINIATGRGDLGKFQQAGEALNTVFFAPRLVASRFQILGGYPYFKASGRTKNLVLREYAKFLTGAALVYALGIAFQDEEDKAVEIDPRSSDFLKLRYGDTRVDPLGGLIQATVFLSRVVSGEKKQLSGKVVPIRDSYRLMNLFRESPRKDKVRYGADNTFDVGANFLRSKFSPSFGAAVDILTGETVVGEKTTPTEVGYKMVMPITFGEAKETLEAHGMPAGPALTIISLFGMGVQTYD